MGYRSELYAHVHGSDLLNFISLLKQHKLDGCFDEFETQNEKGYSKFRTNTNLKWYDTYPDVIAVNTLFNNSDLSVMVRIGEEPGDVEFYGDIGLANDTFSIVTSVEVNF